MKHVDSKISVIMPTFNCEKYIEEAILSVLKQDVNWELIIIDDASFDKTFEKVQPYLTDKRIQYVRLSKNQGVSHARNVGVQLAKGEYLAYLDADDWWKPEKLEKQLKLMQEGFVLCYTGRQLYRQDGSDTGKRIFAPKYLTFQELLKTNQIACSSVMVKREVFETFCWEHDEVHEDYLLWLKILKKYGKAKGIQEPLLCTRLTESGKSRKKRKTIKMTYGVYRLMGIGRGKSCWYVGSHLIRSISRYSRAKEQKEE